MTISFLQTMPHPARDFFELFSFESQYEIDLPELKNRYRELQLKFHPDQYASASEAEKITAVKMSSLLNDGFEVLSQPVMRAKYLLEKSGIDLQNDRVISPEILIEQLELREELEAISAIKSSDEKERKLEILEFQITDIFQVCDKYFVTYAKGELVDESLLQDLKQVLSRMLFIHKLQQEINRELESVDI